MLENNRIKTYSGSGVYYTNDILPESTPEVMAIRKLFRQQLTEGIRSYEAPDVFDYVDLRKVRRDKLSAKSLTSFGTLNSETGPHSKLRVGLDSFRGCSLL